MEPQIQYCTTSDGVSIAYYAMGEGPPMVLASNVLYGNVNTQPISMNEFHRSGSGVGRGQRFIRYDARGTGMSDRSVLDFSIEARVRDLETVVDHLDLASFDLMAFAHGVATAIAYAQGHPERVRTLLLLDGYARGALFSDLPKIRAMSSFRDVAEEAWEEYTLAIANMNLKFSDTARAQMMAERIRSSMSPQALRGFFDSLPSIDVAALLPLIATPTLVVAVNGRTSSDPEWSRELASRIPRARFVMRESKQPLTLDDEIVSIIEEFLGIESAARADEVGEARHQQHTRSQPQDMAVVLFTDIVDSTALTERLGDTVFRTASRALDEGMRAAMRESGGTPVEGKVLGDGVMGVFTSASQAIAAARRCIELSAESELRLHVGLHAGDIIREDSNVYGGAVNIASRICGLSAPGEVLVSATVRELARTSAGVEFEDRGEQEMKGVGEPVRVYAVRGQE